LYLGLIRAFRSILVLILKKRFISMGIGIAPMRIEVRRNPNWEPGVPLMVFKVEYRLMPSMGYVSIVHCGGRQVRLSIDKTGDWLWDYPILAGVKYRDRFMVDVAIPPEVAERLNIVNCIKDVITIPPREYLFATVDSRRDYERFINSEDEEREEGGIVKKVVTASGWSIV
jgi:hypothetical protein